MTYDDAPSVAYLRDYTETIEETGHRLLIHSNYISYTRNLLILINYQSSNLNNLEILAIY